MPNANITLLLIVDRWAFGGIVRHIEDICESLASGGYNCIVAGWLAPGVPLPANADFYNLPLFTNNNKKSIVGLIQSIKMLRRIIRERKVDVIHMHNRYVTFLIKLAAKGGGAGRVYTVHNTFQNLRFLPWYPKNVICLNETGKQTFLRNLFLPKNLDVTLIPNGIRIDPNVSNPFHSELSCSFSYIGRLEKGKGVDILIQAVAELKDTGIKLLVAGSGAEEQTLKALSRELGVSNKVEFLGYLNDPQVVLENSVALVVPSTKLEGMPYVIIEAFAKSRATIASNLAVFDDLVLEGQTGFRFTNGDYLSLARVLRKAMSKTNLLEEMGVNGFAFACKNLTVEQMVHETQKVYKASLCDF